MNNSPIFPKKPTLCRYFASNGQCFYGDSCQFSHEMNNTDQDETTVSNYADTFKKLQPNFDHSNTLEFTPAEAIKKEKDILTNLNSMMISCSSPVKSLLASSSHNYKNGVNPTAVEFVPTPPHVTSAAECNNESTPPMFQSPRQSSADKHNQFGLHAFPSTATSNNRTDTTSPVFSMQENVGGTTYFYSHVDQIQSDLSHAKNPMHSSVLSAGVKDALNLNPAPVSINSANPTSAPIVIMAPGGAAVTMPPPVNQSRNTAPSLISPNENKKLILEQQHYTTADPGFSDSDLPDEVEGYSMLNRLDEQEPTKSMSFGFYTTVYRATKISDAKLYCLRRIHGFRITNSKSMTLIDTWKNLNHVNIVRLYEVFTTKLFGDHSMVFVYHYHPQSYTILEHYFGDRVNPESEQVVIDSTYRTGKHPEGASLLPENIIWTYAIQLSSALRVIHAQNLSCRVLDPSKILVTFKMRLRVNCIGIFDCLSNASTMPAVNHFQQEDLVSLGRIILALACNSIRSLKRDNLQNSLQLVAHNYSSDLKNLILFLTSTQNLSKSVNDIMPMIGARFYVHLDHMQLNCDSLQHQLSQEVHNLRLFRLMVKLGTINERPEYDLDPAWSETGNRYILKLFRDYLFHQVDSNGRPWIDMSHIVLTLNKLDAGVSEKICLTSRDEQSLIIVSYAEIKKQFMQSFDELLPDDGMHTS